MAFKDEGFRFVGGEMGDATGEDGWVDCFAGVAVVPTVATNRETPLSLMEKREETSTMGS